MSEKIRIGFVGVGAMGQMAHLRNYVTISDCEVVALAEVKEKQGKIVGERYGIPNVYKTHTEMMEREQLDGIVCSQPFSRHGVLLKDLCGYGKPIFTEKPLARCVEVGEEILTYLKAGSVRHMVGYHKRSDPATQWAKNEIDGLKKSGELGKMRYVRIVMPPGDWIANGFTGHINVDEQPALPLDQDRPAGDMDEETFGEYISFVNYYIHQVNLMRHLLGESYQPKYGDKAGVLLVGESDSGVTCQIEMSPFSTTIDWQEEALVCFERGWIKIGLPAPLASNRPGTVEVYKDSGAGAAPMKMIPALPWVHAMRAQAENFVSFVKGTGPAPCEAAEALEDLRVAREYFRVARGK